MNKGRERAPDLLAAAAETFRERNALYGDNYLLFGEVMAAFFPQGLPPLRSIEDFNRLGIFVQCAHKLSRYAAQFGNGGHQDSAHDLVVYAAMLEEVTQNESAGF